jgi:hypothetical protein
MEKSTEEEEHEIIFEPIDYTVYINAASEAIRALSDYEPLTKENQNKKSMILRKSIQMISFCICELYDELFTKSEDEES